MPHDVLLFFAGLVLGASNAKYARRKWKVFGIVMCFVLVGMWVGINNYGK